MQILIRGTAEMKHILQTESKRIGITLNALILQILWNWIKENLDSVKHGNQGETVGYGNTKNL